MSTRQKHASESFCLAPSNPLESESPAQEGEPGLVISCGVRSAFSRSLGEETSHKGLKVTGTARRTRRLLLFSLTNRKRHGEFLLALGTLKFIGWHGDPSLIKAGKPWPLTNDPYNLVPKDRHFQRFFGEQWLHAVMPRQAQTWLGQCRKGLSARFTQMFGYLLVSARRQGSDRSTAEMLGQESRRAPENTFAP